MLAAHMLNQTAYLLPETLTPNGNSQDSSIQKDWESLYCCKLTALTEILVTRVHLLK